MQCSFVVLEEVAVERIPMKLLQRRAAEVVLWFLTACSPVESADIANAEAAPPVSPSSDASPADASAPSKDGGTPATDAEQDAYKQGAYPDPLLGIGTPQLVHSGYLFAEGPLWLPAQGKLVFSDINANQMYQFVPGAPAPTLLREPSNYANGNALAPNGAFYTCEQGVGGGRLSRTLPDGTVEAVVTSYAGAKLNSPNDVVVRADGNVYFTDPNFIGNTQAKQNVFRLAPLTLTPTVVDEALNKPNGIALSPDDAFLYVASYAGDFVNRYALAADGTSGPGTRFIASITKPDGLATDDAGNVYIAVNAGVSVYRKDATLLGTIAIPNGKRASNMAFGEADRRTLFITAQTDLYRVRLNVPGRP